MGSPRSSLVIHSDQEIASGSVAGGLNDRDHQRSKALLLRPLLGVGNM
jgi:hypothetical protein